MGTSSPEPDSAPPALPPPFDRPTALSIVEGSEADRALRLFHGQAMALGMYFVVSYPGSLVLVGYALKHIGFSKEKVGLIATLVYGASVLQMLSFLLMNRLKRKRLALVGIGAMEMVFLAGVLALPWLIPGDGARAGLLRQISFLALVFCSAACLQIVSPLLNNWLSVIIPAARRGRYLATRTVLLCGVQTAMAFAAGQAINRFAERYEVFAALMLCGCAAGVAGYICLLRAPMPSLSAESHFTLRDILNCLRHAPYRHYTLFIVLTNVVFALACPYYSAFFLQEVGLSFAQISYYAAAYGVVRLLAIKPAGYAVDRWGARPVLQAMVAIYAVFYAAFPLFVKATFPLIVAVWAMVGMADAVYGVALPVVLYRTVPEGRARGSYFALERSLALTTLALGPLAATLYFGLVGGFAWNVAGLRIEKFRLMYFSCAVIMLLSLPLARRLAGQKDATLRDVVADVLRLEPSRRC